MNLKEILLKLWKVVLGWFVIVILFACIYAVGKLRQQLEFKFNGGYEFYVFFNFWPHKPIDESILGVMS